MTLSKYIEDDIDRNEGGTKTLSADEIAAMLGTYLEGSSAGSGKVDNHSEREAEETESDRNRRRQQRLQEMKRRKKQQELMRKLLIPCIAALVICVILAGAGIRSLVRKQARRQQALPVETVNSGDSGNNNIGENIPGQDDLEDSNSSDNITGENASDQNDSSENVSDQNTLDESTSNQKTSNTGNSSKDIAFNGSLYVAGCYPGSTIADNMNEEIAQISTLFVQTLGGRNNQPPLQAAADETTASPNQSVQSLNNIFIDVEAERIMCQRDAGVRISPASMTKILTVLVAAEHITDPDDTFEITLDITDYSYVNKCSNAGFSVGEKVTVRDLFYGTVLPSGADAALGLAVYAAGSQEAFVELMNEKLDELGLSRTSHFTNCVGLYDENHYSTVYDIAVMLKAACDNDFCREVLSAHTYTTSATEQHPEGIILSNWFLRRIEDKDTYGEVLCAKTGFVEQSGSCAASLSVGNDGREYICVTAHANSSWLCIYDHVALYQQFLSENVQPLTDDV